MLKLFLRAILAWQRRTAGARRGRGGAVVLTQRFGGLLNFNLHFHALVLEGIYTARERDGQAVFHPVRAPTTQEVAEIAAHVAARVRRLFQRLGLADEPCDDSDASALDAAQGAALFGGVAFGPRAGKRVRRLGTGLVRPKRERPSPSLASREHLTGVSPTSSSTRRATAPPTSSSNRSSCWRSSRCWSRHRGSTS